MVLLTEHARYSFIEQLQTVAVMLSVPLIVYVCTLAAARINNIIGSSGTSAISRVMGLILGAVATSNTLSGVKAYFGL